MRKIVITNDKGGVGKTTTVANLSVGLARKGCKTLVVDVDPQGDATFAILGARPPLITRDKPLPKTTYSLLLEKYDLAEVTIKAPRYPNLAIVPSNSDLSQASTQLASQPGSQTVLMQALQSLGSDVYDFVLIDTGKGLDLLVINALAAADDVMVMIKPGSLEIDALKRMMNHIELVRNRTLLGADRPKLMGILLTITNRYSVAKDTQELLEQLYPGKLLNTIIPDNIDLQKAISRAQSIFEFRPESRGAQAYEQLTEEVFSVCQPNGQLIPA